MLEEGTGVTVPQGMVTPVPWQLAVLSPGPRGPHHLAPSSPVPISMGSPVPSLLGWDRGWDPVPWAVLSLWPSGSPGLPHPLSPRGSPLCPMGTCPTSSALGDNSGRAVGSLSTLPPPSPSPPHPVSPPVMQGVAESWRGDGEQGGDKRQLMVTPHASPLIIPISP